MGQLTPSINDNLPGDFAIGYADKVRFEMADLFRRCGVYPFIRKRHDDCAALSIMWELYSGGVIELVQAGPIFEARLTEKGKYLGALSSQKA